jgi:hypothetical protein
MAVTVLNENIERLGELLFATISKVGPQPEDGATALRGARVG